MKERLKRSFYLREPEIVARELLGKRLVHKTSEGETSGLIVETEAYLGRDDAACHSYQRANPTGKHRTDVMFSEGGIAYVYLIYGMYFCFNTVVNEKDNPQAVLVRALQPTQGIPLMQKRRGNFKREKGKPISERNLCNGPGKLCVALGITLEHNGCDLCGSDLFLTEGEKIAPDAIAVTPRINVDYAEEDAAQPLRFVVRESPFLSKFIHPKE